MSDFSDFNHLQDDCLTYLPFRVGQRLGGGIHGTVFDLPDEHNTVVKIANIYSDVYDDYSAKFQRISKTYQFIIDNTNDALVKVFDFGQLYEGLIKSSYSTKTGIIYYAKMEKLLPILEIEQKVFKTICDVYNGLISINRPIKDLIYELKEWFSLDEVKIFEFYDNLHSLQIEHRDVEVRNIMKNSVGQYKLVDFDLAIIKEKENED